MKRTILIIASIILCGCVKDGKKEHLSQLFLMPDQGKMHCNVVIKDKANKSVFALTIPETIGSKEDMILNFPSTDIKWEEPDKDGIVRTNWTTDKLISYSLTLTPGPDFVDAKMTIVNLTDSVWNDVWSFNCLNPTRAKTFKDTLMTRTYMSADNGPKLLSETTRVKGPISILL